MKRNYSAPSVPTAAIAVNKSRLKLYTNRGEMPTYYLQKGQEFQIELFNPTSDVLLAKIQLNGKSISQGGLVINPGQRVFLDRYLDVAKKFLFDTYTVANTEAVKKAIEDNGDIKVEFFKESRPVYHTPIRIEPTWFPKYKPFMPDWTCRPTYTSGTDPKFLRGGNLTVDGVNNLFSSKQDFNDTSSIGQSAMFTNTIAGYGGNTDSYTNTANSVSSMKRDLLDVGNTMETSSLKNLKKKSIETGRVEEGSYSNQTFKYVNKNFDYFPFLTVEYKLLPISEKLNTILDLNVKRYCVNCGAKLGKTDKFCSQCAQRV